MCSNSNSYTFFCIYYLKIYAIHKKNQCYCDYSDGFYVYCPPASHNTTLDCVDSIIPYAGRPVSAQSRIED